MAVDAEWANWSSQTSRTNPLKALKAGAGMLTQGVEGIAEAIIAPVKASGMQERHERAKRSLSVAEQSRNIVGEDSSRSRKYVAGVILSRRFDCLMNLVVVFNLVLVVIATDAKATERRTSEKTAAWIDTISNGLLVIYIIELFARLYVFRMQLFSDGMHVFELCVVLLDVFSLAIGTLGDTDSMPSSSALRVFRLARLARALRLFKGVHELYIIISGFISSLRVIFYGCLVLSVLLVIFAVVAVEILDGPVQSLAEQGVYADCERCPRAFNSVMAAIITLVEQSLIGDNWSTMNTPLIERHPWSLFILCGMWMTINLCVMNLLLSAIVDFAAERRENDKEYKLLQKVTEFDEAKTALKRLCSDMDSDHNQQLEFREILDGYENNSQFFELLNFMDVDKDDLRMVFRNVDTDNSGAVSYDEFIDQVHKMKNQENGLIMVKCHILEIQDTLETRLSEMQQELLKILKDVHDMSPRQQLLDGGDRAGCSGSRCHSPVTRELNTAATWSTSSSDRKSGELPLESARSSDRRVALEALDETMPLILHSAEELLLQTRRLAMITTQASLVEEKKHERESPNAAGRLARPICHPLPIGRISM